jgi:hypothetical protein
MTTWPTQLLYCFLPSQTLSNDKSEFSLIYPSHQVRIEFTLFCVVERLATLFDPVDYSPASKSAAKSTSVASSSSDSALGVCADIFWGGEIAKACTECMDAWSAAREGGTHVSSWKGALADIKDAKRRWRGPCLQERKVMFANGYVRPISSLNRWIHSITCRLRFGRGEG